MNITAKNLLAIAAAELGYCEKETNAQLDDKTANAGDNNYTKYARDLAKYGYYQASKQGFAWCDMFVDHCFLQLCGWDPVKAQEVICQTGPYGAGCEFSAKYYKAQGRFYTSDPQPGDQIFFGRNGSYEHTGIVEKVEGGKVHTIEGNTSNKVARRSYSLTSTYIMGYGRPKFEGDNAEAPEVKPSEPKPTVTGTVSTGSAADEKAMWDHLKGLGLSDIASAVTMGHFFAESGLRSNNVENSYEDDLGLTDKTYTASVDNGSYDNFADDRAGYGLAQWTYPTRKKALLEFALAAKKSIGDWAMQLNFYWKEVQGYKAVMDAFKTGTDIRAVSDIFMVKFENPADKSNEAKQRRASYCQKYYDKYASKTTAPETEPAAPETASDIGVDSIVKFKANAKTYTPNGAKVPDWVKKDFHHVVTQTTSNGKPVIKNGAVCVLLGKKVEKGKTDRLHGINTWVALDNLELVKAATKPAESVKPVVPSKPAAAVKLDYAQDYHANKAGAYRVIAGGGLRLRSGASTAKTILETMAHGSRVVCYGYHTGAWLYVVSESGKTGFCHSDYLTKA